MKGVNSHNATANEKVLISPPNYDDVNGYVYIESDVYWVNETFILYGKKGCWPNLHKKEHCHIKAITKTDQWKPVRGEMVLVRSTIRDEWEPRIFCAEIERAELPFLTVSHATENKFIEGSFFGLTNWFQMKQLMVPCAKPEENPNEMIKVTVTLNGQNINPMRFSRRAWGKIRTNQ